MMTKYFVNHFCKRGSQTRAILIALCVILTAAMESRAQMSLDQRYPYEPLIVALPEGTIGDSTVILLRMPTGEVATNLLDRQMVLATQLVNGSTNSLYVALNQSGAFKDNLVNTGEYTVVVGSITNRLHVIPPPPSSQELYPVLRETGVMLRIATITKPSDIDENTMTICSFISARVTEGPYAEYAKVFAAIAKLYEPFLNTEAYEGRPPPDYSGLAAEFDHLITPTGILRPTFLFHKGYAYRLAGQQQKAMEALKQLVAEYPGGSWISSAKSLITELNVSDQQKPILTILGANPLTIECGGVYADAGSTATDDEDGDITARIAVENNVDTPKVGTYQVIYRVSDAAGNAATATRTVKVVYKFAGFLAPLVGADATGGSFEKPVRVFKLGSTIPLKFGISCGGAAVKDGVHTLQLVKFNNETTAAEPIDATPADAATTGNQFKLAGDEWHYNLDTKAAGLSVGTWQLKATLADGSIHTVWIALK